jgi:hypothetical protein
VSTDQVAYRKNVGYVDQRIRVGLGIALVVWQMIAPINPWAAVLVSAVGGLLIVEGLTRY